MLIAQKEEIYNWKIFVFYQI